jgi:hypothetical protein
MQYGPKSTESNEHQVLPIERVAECYIAPPYYVLLLVATPWVVDLQEELLVIRRPAINGLGLPCNGLGFHWLPPINDSPGDQDQQSNDNLAGGFGFVYQGT